MVMMVVMMMAILIVIIIIIIISIRLIVIISLIIPTIIIISPIIPTIVIIIISLIIIKYPLDSVLQQGLLNREQRVGYRVRGELALRQESHHSAPMCLPYTLRH